MSSTTQQLIKKGLAPDAPSFIATNVMYETIMGSHAYGVADTSVKTKVPDFDVYGWCIPPKEYVFPQASGHIIAFGEKPGTMITFGPCFKGFEQYQRHHMMDVDALGGAGKEWDIQIYNIVKYFELCRENNPNMIDSLFTPDNCVLHCTNIGQMVRDKRRLFLSKLAWKKFRGYAQAQLKKMNDKVFDGTKQLEKLRAFEEAHNLDRKITLAEIKKAITLKSDQRRCDNVSLDRLSMRELTEYQRLYEDGLAVSSRFEIHKFHGFDVKFAYHILRLLDEAEQILLEGDLDLQRAREAMKAVRRGDWTANEIHNWAIEKDKALEAAYTNCKLPERPPVEPIKKLLLDCLENHYGSLGECIVQVNWAESILKNIDSLLNEARPKLYSS